MVTRWPALSGQRRLLVLCLATILIEPRLCLPSDSKNGDHHTSGKGDSKKTENGKHKEEHKTKKAGKEDETDKDWQLSDEMFKAFAPDLDKGKEKDWSFKNISEILDSPPDDNDEWDQTRPLPRSRVLIKAYLKMHSVVPDVIEKPCKEAVEVVYANSVCVDFGNELTEDQVNVMPHRTVWPVEKGAYYTLLLLSPDYPSRLHPTESQYVYWFVANIHDTCVTATGNTFTEYLTPTAVLNETSLHRFVYLVYKQPAGIVAYRMPYTTKYYFDSRKHFNVSEFARDYDLGRPVAANLFQMATVHPNKHKSNKKKH